MGKNLGSLIKAPGCLPGESLKECRERMKEGRKAGKGAKKNIFSKNVSELKKKRGIA